MSKHKAAPQQIRDLPVDDSTRDLLTELAQERINAKVEIDRLKKLIDEDLNPAIMLQLKSLGLDKVKLEDWTVGIKAGSTSWLSAEKLLDAGVHADVIEACRESKDWETVEARGPKDKE